MFNEFMNRSFRVVCALESLEFRISKLEFFLNSLNFLSTICFVQCEYVRKFFDDFYLHLTSLKISYQL